MGVLTLGGVGNALGSEDVRFRNVSKFSRYVCVDKGPAATRMYSC